jgi:CubicO group peptidase (beta-lactamase class C family)
MSRIAELLRSAILPPLQRNFEKFGEIGASVSIFLDGEEVVNVSEGHANRERTRPWTADTLVPVWSATKGPAAVACLLALEEGGLSLDTPVCEVWPRFMGEGRENITFLQVLNHTCGLSALDRAVPIQDYHGVIEALQQQRPAFTPGIQQAYQARTFGFLVDEIVRCITGAESLGSYFRERIGDPMGLDFWIGLPAEQMPRVATLYPGKLRMGSAQDAFQKAYLTKGSLTQRTFVSPAGLNAVNDLNLAETLASGYAGFGGVGSAPGLASFYGMLASGGWWQGLKIVSDDLLQKLEITTTQQEDAVLCSTVASSAGMMRDPMDAVGNKLKRLFGSSSRAYGHPGAGGSMAYADPEKRLAFAYVMNQMELGAMPGEKTLSMMEAVDAVV